MAKKFLDFELIITTSYQGEYSVQALSPAGQIIEKEEGELVRMLSEIKEFVKIVYGKEFVKFNFILKGNLNEIKIDDAIYRLGNILYHILFYGEVRTLYYQSREIAAQLGKGLRLKLRIKPRTLATLGWELLYDPQLTDYVGLSNNTLIVRVLEKSVLEQIPLIVTQPLRILGMVASPFDLPLLDIKEKKQQLEQALFELQRHGLVELTWVEGETWHDLRQAVLHGNWHIFHFIGHGSIDEADEGFIALTKKEGETSYFSTLQLSELLAGQCGMRLVLLNLCKGSRSRNMNTLMNAAAYLIPKGIPAVLATPSEISAQASIQFAHTFYKALAEGLPVDLAVSEARKVLSIRTGTVEWATPVLYMNSSDGQIFDIRTVTTENRQQITAEQPLSTEAELLAQLVQAKQIEQNAGVLESCTDVVALADSYRHLLGVNGLVGPASALLRSFSRISQDVEAAIGQQSVYNQRLALKVVEEQLDKLYRELVDNNQPYAKTFFPITNLWRKMVNNHTYELIKAMEQEEEIDSPYVIGIPLTPQQKIFVGRSDISRRIEQLLLDPRCPPLLLYGQRRTGKTSLLNNLGRLLPSTIVPFFVDLQGPVSRASNNSSFLYNLARGMVNSAKVQRDLILPRLSREELAADPFTCFDEWLDEIEALLGQNTALLALDEFEALDRAISKARFDEEDVLGMLRHLIQHRPRFKVLLAGSHTLHEFQRWASYLINVQVLHISYLKENEARQLIEQPVKGFPLRYEPDASQRVLALTRCHPFLVQLLCAEIVAVKNEQNEQQPAVRRLVHLADVEEAIPEALMSGSFFFGDMEHNQVDAAGRNVLRFLASQGEGAIVKRQLLERQVVNPNFLAQTLDLLMQRELLEEIDGGYRFQVELIRRWFTQ